MNNSTKFYILFTIIYIVSPLIIMRTSNIISLIIVFADAGLIIIYAQNRYKCLKHILASDKYKTAFIIEIGFLIGGFIPYIYYSYMTLDGTYSINFILLLISIFSLIPTIINNIKISNNSNGT